MKEPYYRVGDRVLKHSGDYQLEGKIVAKFENRKGRKRYVVEHPIADGAFYHIYAPENIRLIGEDGQ